MLILRRMRLRFVLSPVTVYLLTVYSLAGLWTILIARGSGPWANARAVPLALNNFPIALVIVAFAGLIIFLLRHHSARVVWEILFFGALFFGVWYMGLLVLPFSWATIVAACLIAMPLIVPRMLTHDIFVMIGSIGVALNFALRLTPAGIVLFLVGFMLYDMLVFGSSGPLLPIVRELLRGKSVPGMVVPISWRGWWSRIDKPWEENAMLLGIGDLILPLTLVARAAFSGWSQALVVLGGSLLGLLVLIRGSVVHPRIALPWLAIGGIVPFLLLHVTGLLL